uniref:C2H2-type domain-containing protein n=2 Tax=Bursaphelenchus xylophilus TaxID=6326 RepID=A0A1I7SJE0_BURXY
MPALQTLSMNVTAGHSIVKTEEPTLSCQNCGLKFTQNETLKRHQLFYCKTEENGS